MKIYNNYYINNNNYYFYFYYNLPELSVILYKRNETLEVFVDLEPILLCLICTII